MTKLGQNRLRSMGEWSINQSESKFFNKIFSTIKVTKRKVKEGKEKFLKKNKHYENKLLIVLLIKIINFCYFFFFLLSRPLSRTWIQSGRKRREKKKSRKNEERVKGKRMKEMMKERKRVKERKTSRSFFSSKEIPSWRSVEIF